MVDEKTIAESAKNGLPALKELFDKLPKDDALKGLGILVILVILGIGSTMIDAVVKIVTSK